MNSRFIPSENELNVDIGVDVLGDAELVADVQLRPRIPFPPQLRPRIPFPLLLRPRIQRLPGELNGHAGVLLV